ncbi:hypothetical protein [Larsenimonas rhizosphaerae]|uniref:hypothetical protein n=1 Tax=Larsenimonas rhizosphaerae TaxID=2944682 RepID=UPI002033AED3|nr:hypothetical protein [Larsenimonas rhizosphaerae]MCM2131788.1 hypothetical protein [Larsenimonas rhizosphaerae]
MMWKWIGFMGLLGWSAAASADVPLISTDYNEVQAVFRAMLQSPIEATIILGLSLALIAGWAMSLWRRGKGILSVFVGVAFLILAGDTVYGVQILMSDQPVEWMSFVENKALIASLGSLPIYRLYLEAEVLLLIAGVAVMMIALTVLAMAFMTASKPRDTAEVRS